MRTNSLLWISLMTTVSYVGAREPEKKLTYTMGFPNGIEVRAVSVLEGAEEMPPPGGISFDTDRNILHRVLHDPAKKIFLGYDLAVEPIAGARRIRVIFMPLSLSLSETTGDPWKIDPELHYMILPQYPPPQIVDDGDTIALDLLVSPDGKKKVVDYLHIYFRTSTKENAAKHGVSK
jgi:hypothetical protein